MAYAPIRLAREAQRVGDAPSSADSAGPPHLEPVDYTILGLLFRKVRAREVAEVLGLSEQDVLARTQRPVFKALQHETERGVVARVIAVEEREPVTLAKLAAAGAMRRVIAMGKTSPDARVALAANDKVLRYAGVEPPQRIQLVSPDEVLEQMTAEELHHYAETRRWPERFREQLSHLVNGGASVSLHETVTTRARSVLVRPAPTDEPDERDLVVLDEGAPPR